MSAYVVLVPELLSNIPIFESLDHDELKNIINSPDNSIEEYSHRELIVRESEDADCMYIILEGRLEIVVRGAPPVREIAIATLKPGDFFGEQALLPGSTGKRNASVRAFSKAKIFRIAKKHVLLSLKRSEEKESNQSANLKNIKNRAFGHDVAREMIMTLPFFKNLTNKELEMIDHWTENVTFSPDNIIIKKFQRNEHLYVIVKGLVEVFNLDDQGKVIVLAKLGHGKLFGEQALMPGSTGKSNSFVKAKEETIMIKIAKRHFRALLSRNNNIAVKLQQIHKHILKK